MPVLSYEDIVILLETFLKVLLAAVYLLFCLATVYIRSLTKTFFLRFSKFVSSIKSLTTPSVSTFL